ncbi:MAG: transcriptional repressor [Clostridiales bacterium]|nr:transcriptional repressor [Clostridiales bacterium]
MSYTEDAQTRLRRAGLRVTMPRVVIYEYLLNNRTHPTCDQIYNGIKKNNPGISLASVYNVTEKLADEKLLLKIVSPDGERHYDSLTDFHGHFFCLECKKIFDLSCRPDFELEELKGAQTTEVSLSVKGICPECVDHS